MEFYTRKPGRRQEESSEPTWRGRGGEAPSAAVLKGYKNCTKAFNNDKKKETTSDKLFTVQIDYR